ncbi:MAG: MBL fold metallo-hydrolase, partial [Nitrospirota bacterium]
MRVFLFLLLSGPAFAGGLDRYARLVASDSGPSSRNALRVTYLGTNGYQFEFKGRALLVDPYFSRVDLWSVALGARIGPNISRIDDGLHRLTLNGGRSFAFSHGNGVHPEHQTSPKIDAILVTHGHFDHLLDVPIILSRTHAHLIASASSVDLANRAGASSADKVTPGDVRQIGPWKIRVASATHDRLFGKVPFDRRVSTSGPPQRPADWVCGEPLAFIIEVSGQRIYIDSGGTPAQLPPNEHV